MAGNSTYIQKGWFPMVAETKGEDGSVITVVSAITKNGNQFPVVAFHNPENAELYVVEQKPLHPELAYLIDKVLLK